MRLCLLLGVDVAVSGSGDSGLSADVAVMVASAQRLLDLAEDVESRYRGTREGVDDLLGRSWKGIAPRTHQELWADWDEGFTAVQTALTGMAATIADAAHAFEAQDSGR